jgi:hypothetical protein
MRLLSQSYNDTGSCVNISVSVFLVNRKAQARPSLRETMSKRTEDTWDKKRSDWGKCIGTFFLSPSLRPFLGITRSSFAPTMAVVALKKVPALSGSPFCSRARDLESSDQHR